MVISAAIICLQVDAQVNMGARFNKLTHDFGKIPEESGTVYTIFSFKNITSEPIHIVNIETSCGCTKPIYSKDTIMPGDSGHIKAVYETWGRDGDFYKNLFVHFNKEAYYQPLSIRGYVVPQANLSKRPAEFTTTYSNLAFTTTIAHFPDLLNSQKQTTKLKVYNYMGYPINILEIKSKPEFVTVDYGDGLIGVEDTLTITITIDGTKMTQFGDQMLPVALVTDDPGSEVKNIFVRANLKEDFSKLSGKELKNAPRIAITPPGTISLGKHSAGEKFSHTLKIENTGKKDLEIRKIIPSCSCISFTIGKQVLKAGESTNLVLTIDTVNQIKADLIKHVTLLTNDPAKQELNLKITLTVTN